MSVRPLPVTATFKPIDYYDRLYPGLSYNTQDVSDCSDGSTESLTSILHHDSYFDSNEEDTNSRLVKESLKKLRCRGDDSKPKKNDETFERWPAHGNRAITKEFVSSAEFHVGSEASLQNAPDVNGVTAMVYVHQASRQKRFIAPKKSPCGSIKSVGVTPRRTKEKSHETKGVEDKKMPKQLAPSMSELSKSSDESSVTKSESLKRDTTPISQKGSKLTNLDEDTDDSKATESHTTVSETWEQSSMNLASGDGDLTAWEKWLLNKEKQSRRRQKIEQRKKVRTIEENRRLTEEKQEKSERQKAKITAWLEAKNKKEKEEKQRQLLAKQEEETEETNKKREIAVKAEIKYKEWCTALKLRESELKSKQEEEQRNQTIRQEEKKVKADEAYQKWLKDAVKRPITVPYSYGFSDGKLTGYYDKSSNPPPSYVNPRPWINSISEKGCVSSRIRRKH